MVLVKLDVEIISDTKTLKTDPIVQIKCLMLLGLESSTVDQVLKYSKYPKYILSTSTGQVLIFLKVLKYIKYFHIKYKYKYKYSY